MGSAASVLSREPWNKGKIVGQKAPFKLKDLGTSRPATDAERNIGLRSILLHDD